MGLIVGGAIGAMLGGGGGTMSSVLLQTGTCWHCPLLQSHVQVHCALAGPATESPSRTASVSVFMCFLPRREDSTVAVRLKGRA